MNTRRLFGLAWCLVSASMSHASVQVDFFNSTIPPASGLTNDLGVLTLSFSVGGTGNVTLDASTTQTIPATIDAVDAWDGNVGTISYTGAFGTVFSLVVNDVGGSGLKLTDNGGGVLGVGGLNAWRIDNPGVESVTMDATVPGAALDFQTISWAHRANITVDMLVEAPSGSATNSLPSVSGTWDVSAEDLVVEDGEQLVVGNVNLGVPQDGYGLAGISFDLVPPAPPVANGIVTVAFPNSLLAKAINAPVRLDFTVDGTGDVTLDASTTSTNAEAIAAVNGWDGYVGGFTHSMAFNATFHLQLEAAKQSGAAFVNLSEIAPGGIGVAGHNSSRIDGGGLAIPDVETLRIVASTGAAKVEFKTLSWNNSVNGVEMTAAAGGVLATNSINAAPGTWTLANTGTNFVVATGESLSLSTVSANGFALAGFTFSLITPPAPPPRTNDLPNVVVIVADDLGYSDISYNPFHGPEVSTPHIDSLISDGVWFSSAYASGNICAPSRAGFFIGSYQQRIGVHNETDVNGAGFSSTAPIFPQHLNQQFDGVEDYATKMVGKWHMGRDRSATVSIDGNSNGDYTEYDFDYGVAVPDTMVYHPMRRGFDEVYGFVNLGGQSYWNYEYGFFDDWWRFERDTPIDGVADGDALDTYLTTRFTEEACTFIETQAASNRPFFLHLAYNAVHTPMEAPVSPVGLSEGDPGWYPDAAWYDAHFPNMWQTPGYSDSNGQAQDQATRAILMAMLYHMDQGIGQVVDTLKTNGVWDNTIVVFWSDNGGASASRASNNPLRERKHFNYEGGIRVPMAVSWPAGLGAFSNTVVAAPVMSIDILPTVLDAIDIEPLNGFETLDGKSLLPLIRGEVTGVHDALYWSEGGEAGEYSVRQGDWKLYIDEDVYELYNLAADIGETNDLSTVHPERVRQMRQDFYAWMVEMVTAAGDQLDDRLWAYTTAPAPGESPVEYYSVETENGSLELEYDEKAGWVGGSTVFESTDALTNGWAPVTPASFEPVDRFLDLSTYRVVFPAGEPRQFFRLTSD